ncbi:T9SS type A sorting domain-containing protein [Chryseobacterium jejuense]|uniref:Por secretion system C-terminal sorting domain n=1 Tax=Chryseobacterium jejuense TaxID=445960 RepID=A0A2X2ZAE3_CHRJE|nr:T9SS type A sorting domain-containing protein [Chryseobacterium jejuense]SDI19052.1 Por secretion system C-terminal sorting domain-containing protein [Chryseobacterium jejuense]SQB46639.1 Por secretion system C-terminal sorting domain [Chryseobacterium jejuense]
MKKTFLFFFMTFLMSWNGLKAQGQGDYIIMLDNGGSMNQEDYHTMRRGAIKLIEQLLACNSDNRVAVVQYGTGVLDEDTGVYKPLIYIESDFTNDFFTAQNFYRRLDFGDYLQQSVGLVRDAIDGIPNPDIISPQKTLNIEHDTRVIVFTDAERASNGLSSYLVDPAYASNYASYEAFANVMDFKIDRAIRFSVIHANTNDDAIKAAASIASPFGPYDDDFEDVPGDPHYGYPKSYYNRTNGFHMLPTEINYWKDLAAFICNSSGRGTVDFLYEPGVCINGTSGLSGNYYLEAGAAMQEIKLELVNLDTGEVYPIIANPVLGIGNSFHFSFTPSSFTYAVLAGSTGPHKFRVKMTSTSSWGTVAYSWNKYPFFDYDINLNCPTLMSKKSSVEEKMFKLTPNPTSGMFKVILNKEFKSGTLEIRDLVGNTVHNKILRGEKEIVVDLSSRKEGVYIVNITTDKNEIYSEKIIKK